MSTWEHDLPTHRRLAGLRSQPDISLEALQEEDMLQDQVLRTALTLGVIQAPSVPGLAPPAMTSCSSTCCVAKTTALAWTTTCWPS